MKYIQLGLAATLMFAVNAYSKTYNIDAAHSSVAFKIKHLVISTVTGYFKTFSGTFDFDEATGKISNLKVSIDAASLDTNEPDRDKHLRSEDFFNVAAFPKIEFTSSKTDVKNKKTVKLTGDLQLLGKTKPLQFNFDYKGAVTDPWGNARIAFEATSALDRRDFGMTWNKNLDKGGLLIGNEVKIFVEAEAMPAEKSTEKKS